MTYQHAYSHDVLKAGSEHAELGYVMDMTKLLLYYQDSFISEAF